MASSKSSSLRPNSPSLRFSPSLSTNAPSFRTNTPPLRSNSPSLGTKNSVLDASSPSIRSLAGSQTSPDAETKGLDDGGFDFLGKELDDNARIWNVYRDEVTADDKAHGFEGWLQTLDVLLIFAGLFSAVVTAFLIDSYKLLQKPDKDDFIAAALYSLVVATNNSALLHDLPKPSSLSSTPSFGERCTNALWFTSLIIALAVALLSILAKQWLQEFHRRLSERPSSSEKLTSSEWARKRWFYLKGITRWPTDSFITYILPLMLHIALFLFLVGLVIFLWTLDDVVASLVLSLTFVIFAFYVACTLLPLWFPDAPTCTPLLSQTVVIVRRLRLAVLAALISAWNVWDKLKQRFFGSRLPSFSLPSDREQRLPAPALARLLSPRDPSVLLEESVDDRTERLTDMLKWLIVTCTSENAVMMGFQAVSALDFDSPLIPRLREATVGMSALTHFGSNKTPSTLDAIRAIRSELVLGRGSWRGTRLVLNVPDNMLTALKNLPNSDAILLHAAVRGCLLEDIHIVIGHLDSESITTRSALLLLRCKGSMDLSSLLCLLAILDLGVLDHRDYDRIFDLFASWRMRCTCGNRSLLCLLPLIADIQHAGPGGEALWRSSLPAFVASRLIRYCAQSGISTPGGSHRSRRHRLGDAGLLYEFLNHPGWLHPMVWPDITTILEHGTISDFPTDLYAGSDIVDWLDQAVDALISMLRRFPLDKLTTRGELAPLATLAPFTSHDFHSMLLETFRSARSSDLEVLKLILVKSLRFLLFVAASKKRASVSYTCTEALLGIAIGFSWMNWQGQSTDSLLLEPRDLVRLVRSCSWRDVDWRDPTVAHLAQHLREVVPDHATALSSYHWERDNDVAEKLAPLRELIANATQCTEPRCPGRRSTRLAIPQPRYVFRFVLSSPAAERAQEVATSNSESPPDTELRDIVPPIALGSPVSLAGALSALVATASTTAADRGEYTAQWDAEQEALTLGPDVGWDFNEEGFDF